MGERRGMKGLELWCRKVTEGYPGVKIDNMTTSWRDGLAFCAMIHHFRPDLIDFDKLNKEDIYHNNELAFRVAEHHLGIPALLEAEDMVEFEVPDRLSILTYLSQFYQTFEVARGKSGPRVAAKRPTSTPDHGIVSPASTSPPSKVPASTTSRVRREPCAKCKLPVFIAERLNIGKLLYHRTCFKCARCKSQLTLANYYETESGEFCCEVCPDEEHFQNLKNEESSVLQRSLSDEEKSASLRKYATDNLDAYSSQFESALESPTDTELRKNFTLSQNDSKARMSFFQSQLEDKQCKLQDAVSSSSAETLSEEAPPNLPKTVPPNVDSSFPEYSSSKNTQHLENKDSFSVNKSKNFVTKDVNSPSSVKARLRLFENLDSKEKSEKVHLASFSSRNSPEKAGGAKVINLSDLEDFDNISKKETDSDGISLKSERRSASVEKGDISSENRFENKNELDISKEEFSGDNAPESPLEIKSIKTSEDDHKKCDNITETSSGNKTKSELSKAETSNEILNKHEGFANQSAKRFSSSKHIELKFDTSNNVSNSDKSGQSTNYLPLEICDSSQENVIFSIEGDSGNISLEKKDSVIEILDSEKEDSVIQILDSSQESNNNSKPADLVEVLNSTQKCDKSQGGSDMVQISVEPSSPVVTISDDSYLSAKEGLSGFETTVATQAFATAREILPPTEVTTLGFTSKLSEITYPDENLENVLKNNLKGVEPSSVFDKELKSHENVTNAVIEEEKDNSNNQIKNLLENNEKDLVQAVNVVLKDAKEKAIEDTYTSKKIEKLKPNEIIDYPEDMNPFEDEEEENDGDGSSKASLIPLGGDTEEEEPALRRHPSNMQTPTAASRKKKIIPKDEDRLIDGTPECLQRIYTERISINPFEEPRHYPPKMQTPTAASRKKKIIPKDEDRLIDGTPECLQRIYTERISLNPFGEPRHYPPKMQTPTAALQHETPDSLQRVDTERISLNPFEDLSEEEEENHEIQKSTPSPRQRKKIIPIERPSLNPFGSEEEEEEEEKIVPVPKFRHLRTSSIPSNSLATPPTSHALSPSSRSSYGGSTSSISSGSAFGSARKKKPAPRPPLPDFKSNLLGTASPSTISLTSSISSSISPRSHGKTKRAPPPPSNISTPFPATNQNLQKLTVLERDKDRLSFDLGISPINYDNDKAVEHEGNKDKSFESVQLHDKVETDKFSKDEENRSRQSLESNNYKLDNSEIDRIINNKSHHGKWKRQKGKAPSRPIPQRRIIKSLPLSEIRRELDTIEIQQQGLEKQGVRLEQIIRDKCEGDGDGAISPDDSIPIDVEDLILQLFELVNEKNELFRRQAELMYLRRQQRLEEEHADVEYQIRCIMMQPEANKTDSDKAREEALINRLVEIVERRNEIIECLEMDRIRETEEDDSISSQLNLYSMKRENEKDSIDSSDKKQKKDIKRKLKKIKLPFHIHKHKEKGQKVELDKDVDTMDVNAGTLEKKKKKKFNLFQK